MDYYDLKIMEKVKETRLKLDFTVQEVSGILDVSQNFINNVESSKTHHKYNIKHLVKMAFLFDCSIGDFILDYHEFFNDSDLMELKNQKGNIIKQRDRRIIKEGKK